MLEDDPATPGEEDVLAKDVLDLTDKLDKDGTLRWTVPDGAWVILRFGYTNNGARVSTASGEWSGFVLDYLDADAFRWYWHEVIDPIVSDAGPLCGKVWKMVQTDSWELGGVNWTVRSRTNSGMPRLRHPPMAAGYRGPDRREPRRQQPLP